MSNRYQKGFGVIEVILLLAVLGLLVFIGWRIYANQMDAPSQRAAVNEETPQVKTTDDLQKAEQYLNTSDIDKELDTSEIDAVLN